MNLKSTLKVELLFWRLGKQLDMNMRRKEYYKMAEFFSVDIFFFFLFIYDSHRERERDAET